MPNNATPALGFSRTALGLIALAALLAGLVAASIAAGPASAAVKTLWLGDSSTRLEPDCGNLQKTCKAEGRVTGFVSRGVGFERKHPYVSPWKGKLVSWSISLSRPFNKTTEYPSGETKTVDEVAAFGNLFGAPASARISILKRIRKTKPPRYKLVRQGPTEILNPYFGSKVQFVLDNPLTIMPKQVVALTIPTWAPAFWHDSACDTNLNGDLLDPAACDTSTQRYTWRASRSNRKCSPKNQAGQASWAKNSHPAQVPGKVKKYGCYYRASQLVYSALIARKG